MNIEHLNRQKQKDKFWRNEDDMPVEVKRLTKLEKLQEVKAFKLLTEAHALNQKLSAFKEQVKTDCQAVFDEFCKEVEQDGRKPPKGNYTWYNFNRTIKIEVSISQPIVFDDMGIMEVKLQLQDFVSKNLNSEVEFLKELVMSAFETSRGKLDSKKVMGLLRYRSKVNRKEFSDAMDLLEASIRRPKSRTYFRVWAKNQAGKFESIDLNFSSVSESC